MPELSGYLWLLINLLMVVVLGAAILYAALVWRRRRRDRELERARNDATRRIYRE
jgi:hypothetical protein